MLTGSQNISFITSKVFLEALRSVFEYVNFKCHNRHLPPYTPNVTQERDILYIFSILVDITEIPELIQAVMVGWAL